MIIVEKYVDVMKQSVELSDTLLEGLQHIQKLLGEGNAEQTIYMFEDVLLAYSTIEGSIEPIKEELKNEELTTSAIKLKQTLELVVSNYEAKDYNKVQEVIQFTLVPQVKKWKQQLQGAFQPY